MHKFSDDDMQMLYQLVHAESGNQDLTTQEAVASVVINRVMSEYFPNSVSSELLLALLNPDSLILHELADITSAYHHLRTCASMNYHMHMLSADW